MSTDPDYITEQAFYDYIKSPRTTGNDNVLAAITAASRAIDAHCGRRFYSAWEEQLFRVDSRRDSYLWLLDLDDMDIANFDNQAAAPHAVFEVATEQGNDGTYATIWTPNVDFIGEPVNRSQGGIIGWPYTSLRAIGGRVWPIDFVAWQRATVRIRANFGWTDVPDAVQQAAKITTAYYTGLGTAALGFVGVPEAGPIRVGREVPEVAKSLLLPFRKGQAFGIS